MIKQENDYVNGKTIAHLTYVSGNTRLDHQRLPVALDAHPVFLLVRRRSRNQNLLAIPWTNIGDMEIRLVEKSYAGKALADIFSPFSWFSGMEVSALTEYGLTLNHWDEEVQRDQATTFAIGSDPRRFETLQHAILLYRDQFMAPLGPNSRPNRR